MNQHQDRLGPVPAPPAPPAVPDFDADAELTGASFASHRPAEGTRLQQTDPRSLRPPPLAGDNEPLRPTPDPTTGEPSTVAVDDLLVAAPAPVPYTAADLEERRHRRPAGKATWGWRGRANRWSGGLVKLRQSQPEIDHLAAEAMVRRSFDGPRTIVVINTKGGAGKTTSAWMLARTLGVLRGGGVACWDNNETTGTLGFRGVRAGHTRTARDLLESVHRFDSVEGSRVGDLAGFVRAQGDAHFDLLASDDRLSLEGQIDAGDVEALRKLMLRFYKLLVIDTGNNMRAPNWVEAVYKADHVLIPSPATWEGGSVGLKNLETLRENNISAEWLRQNATAVLWTAPGGGRDREIARELREAFGSHVGAVHDVPLDREFSDGTQIDHHEVSPATHAAWLKVAASIAERL